MTTEKLKALKEVLTEFRNDDMFGLGEMAEIAQIDTVIELVDGAIINIKQACLNCNPSGNQILGNRDCLTCSGTGYLN